MYPFALLLRPWGVQLFTPLVPEVIMKRNESNTDRLVRVGLAAAVVALALWLGATTFLGIALLTVAAVLLVTAAVGFCPLYALAGVSTCPVPTTSEHGQRVGRSH